MATWLGWLLGGGCAICGRSGPSLCQHCAWRLRPADPIDAPPPLASLAALVRYEDRGRDLVAAIKYHNRRAPLPQLGRALALLLPQQVDMISWVPTTAARRRRRGFDQGAALATSVGRAGARPVVRTLRRLDRQAQTGRTRRQRQSGPQLAAVGRPGGVVVLVDDVVTTGSTLRAGAVALLGAGASEVHGLALAQTPG